MAAEDQHQTANPSSCGGRLSLGISGSSLRPDSKSQENLSGLQRSIKQDCWERLWIHYGMSLEQSQYENDNSVHWRSLLTWKAEHVFPFMFGAQTWE